MCKSDQEKGSSFQFTRTFFHSNLFPSTELNTYIIHLEPNMRDLLASKSLQKIPKFSLSHFTLQLMARMTNILNVCHTSLNFSWLTHLKRIQSSLVLILTALPSPRQEGRQPGEPSVKTSLCNLTQVLHQHFTITIFIFNLNFKNLAWPTIFISD